MNAKHVMQEPGSSPRAQLQSGSPAAGGSFEVAGPGLAGWGRPGRSALPAHFTPDADTLLAADTFQAADTLSAADALSVERDPGLPLRRFVRGWFQKRAVSLRWLVALLLVTASLIASFLPQYAVIIVDRLYLPPGWRLLLAPLSYQGVILAYPWLARLAEGLVLGSLLGALALLLWHGWQLLKAHRAGRAVRASLPAPIPSATPSSAAQVPSAPSLAQLRPPGLIAGLLALAAAGRLVSLLGMANLPAMLKTLDLPTPLIITNTAPYYTQLLAPLLALVLVLWQKKGEAFAQAVFQASAYISVASVAMITFYMLVAGLPAVIEIGPLNFLFGTVWKPTSSTLPQFGVLPMMLATVAATVGAVLIGVPVGLLTSVFLAEIAPPRLADLVRPAIELLAGIPSVIYGFFGLQLLVPLVARLFNLPTGANLFSAIIILAIMILPTIISTAETGLRGVPSAYKEASLALGATHVMTIFKVLIPAAASPILSGVILGVGRAIGETMAVIMVAGNVPNLPGLFTAVRPLTVGIALEMSYASGLHQQALFAIGLVLFIFIMLVNISFSYLARKGGGARG